MKRFLRTLMTLMSQCYHILFAFNNSCRFEPSCSQYMAEALGRFGLLKGLILSFGRILRCRPGGGDGLDPVPGTRCQ